MAVAALTYDDKHASYSNEGVQIEIAAPGGERNKSIYSSIPERLGCRDISPQLPHNGYCTKEGTSMAAAIVSGAAALIMSVRPDLTADQVRKLLKDTAVPVAESATRAGAGRVDVEAALRRLLPTTLKLTNNITHNVAQGSAPFTTMLRIENPSSQVLTVTGNLLNTVSWVALTGATDGVISTTAQYTQPAYLPLTFTPTALSPGLYSTTLRLEGVNAKQDRLLHTVEIDLVVTQPTTPQLYLPFVLGNLATITVDYRWEEPLAARDRMTYSLSASGTTTVTLPFAVGLKGSSYTDLRLHADGYVSFPGNGPIAALGNRCLPNLLDPQQAIYGWWADLDPSAAGASVSSFTVGSDLFVVEFANVPTATGVTPAYVVSFQIALYKNGKIRLNYQQAPAASAPLPQVTIGVEAQDGRFYNQIACKDGAKEVGYLPRSHQSLLLDTNTDIY